MPILTREAARSGVAAEVLFIDAFAGPGEYASGEPGSPFVAIRTATDHAQDFQRPVRMYFVEKRLDRWKHLNGLLAGQTGVRRNAIIEPPILGKADVEVSRLLDTRTKSYTPTLVFLDQFGYSAVPMDLVKRILTDRSCEVFSFINWRDLNHYLGDEDKWAGIDGCFGGTEWRDILRLSAGERSHRFLQLYDNALRVQAKARFCCTFALHDRHDQLLAWLVFASNNDRGLEEMKRAMWRVDQSGRFRFSDKHSGQLRLLRGFDQQWLADTLLKTLAGSEMSVADIRHFVLTETPCYLYSSALQRLERNSEVEVKRAPPGRRKGSFAKFLDDKGVTVRFKSRQDD